MCKKARIIGVYNKGCKVYLSISFAKKEMVNSFWEFASSVMGIIRADFTSGVFVACVVTGVAKCYGVPNKSFKKGGGYDNSYMGESNP